MSAPHTVATVFVLVSLGSVLMLAIRAATAATRDALARICQRAPVTNGRSPRLATVACRLRHDLWRRLGLEPRDAAPSNGFSRRRRCEGVLEHAAPESLGIHRGHSANTVANPMEAPMTWTNRITIAATLIGGAIALMAYAQALSLPTHFA